LSDKFRLHLNTIEIALLIYILFQIALVLLFGHGARERLLMFYFTMTAITIFLIILPYQDRPSFLHFAKYFCPLLIIFLLYRVLGPQIQVFGFSAHDSMFNALEKSILGIYPSFALQRVMEVWLNEVSFALYAIGIVLPIWVIIKLYDRSHYHLFENFVLAVVLGCLTCLIITTVYPVIGPAGALSEYYYLGFYGPYFSVAVPMVMQIVSPQIGSFPAIYFCLLTISAYYIWDFGRAYVIASFIILTGVFWGGIYLRYHYIVDALIALLIAFLASTIAGYVYYLKYEQPGKRRPLSS